MKNIKKYFISFLVVFCVFIGSSFSVFASGYFNCSISQPVVTDFKGYIEMQNSSNEGFVLFFTITSFDSSNIPTVNFTASTDYLEFYLTDYSNDSRNRIDACLYMISTHTITNFVHYNDSNGNYIPTRCRMTRHPPFQSIRGLNCYGCVTPIPASGCTYFFVYGSDNVSNEKLDNIYSVLQSLIDDDTSKAPQQSDKDAINSTESKQDELMESTNPTDKTESLQTDLMSFVNSAPDTLNVAKSMFDRLVSGKIGIIVFGSVCLAIFPLLINVIKGRGG